MNRTASLPQSRPSLFRDLKYKGPFIDDQRLRLLVLPDDGSVQAMDCFDLSGLRAGRRAAEDEGHSGEPPLRPDCRWEPVTTREDRIELLANAAAHPRMLITIEAGIGKTTAVQQLLYLRNCSLPGHLALGARLSELPDSHRKYLEGADRVNPWLVDLLAPLESFRDADPAVLLKLIHRKLVQGNLTLVVDAFDQTGGRDVDSQVQALAAFINRYPEIRLVCTGRPNSILDHRAALFGNGPWTVIQVAEFDESQIIRYIEQDRFDAIRETMDVELQSQPRMLEAIRELTPNQLRGLRTGAALHWTVIEKTVFQALRDQSRPPRLTSLWLLLSAIAFQMTFERNFDGVPEGDDFDAFVERLMRDRLAIGTRYGNDHDRLEKDLIEIGRLNEILDFAVMEEGRRVQLYFRNRTLQTFFAALWLTRFSATPEEQRWLQEDVFYRSGFGDYSRFGRYSEFKTFMAEMPGPFARRSEVWLRSVASLFLPLECTDASLDGLTGRIVRRSPEMIWRVWWPLLELATGEQLSNEKSLFDATTQYQRGVRKRFGNGQIAWHRTSGDSVTASVLLDQFLLEFVALAAGQIGRPDQQQLAAEFDRCVVSDDDRLKPEHGFVCIPAGPHHFGEGTQAIVLTQASDFWLSRFPITNELIRLFDPSHGIRKANDRYSDYSQYSPESNCPAIYCDWYTSWCLATWLHGILPDEPMFESAARGNQRPPGPATRFGFEGASERLMAFAWVRENACHMTQPVGGAQESKLPNGFGLYHILGSVWEWTRTEIEARTWSGVQRYRHLRGGSFRGFADYVRCADGFSDNPFGAEINYGLRVARTE